MLLVDDLIAAPFKGLFWVFKKIHRAAVDELEQRRQETRGELTELYMQLETGRISEREFDAREKELLDRLEQVQEQERQIESPPAREKANTEPR
jgi:uncharacterized protein involved in exopolysaccharide biosynthesis